MKRFAFRRLREPSYWSTWTLSVCIHTVMVGIALLLSDQLPAPQQPERDPIAVSFVTPEPTHTAPTHLQILKKSPPTPTTKAKLAQPEAIPREPTRSKKPRRRIQNRQTVVPRRIVHPTFIAPQPMPQLTNVTQTPVAQQTTFRNTQTASQPTVRNGTVSSQAVTRAVGRHAPQPISQPVTQAATQPAVKNGRVSFQPASQHAGIARQHVAPKVHASSSHMKPIHVEATIGKVDPVMPRDLVIHNHVASAPQRIAASIRESPLRKSVSTLASHDEMRTRTETMAVMKRQVSRGKSYTAVKHVSSKPVRQQASLSSGRPVVATRTTVNYTRQTRKARPATTARTVSTNLEAPDLTAFKNLLLERISQALEYPRLARRLGYSGITRVAVSLSKTGVVRDLRVSQPSGYDILDKAAIVTLEKVLKTTKPPESIEIVVPIGFDLKSN